MSAHSAYAAPTPQVFYIHDDLSDEVRHTHGEHSRAFQLAQELLTLVRRDLQRVIVLQLEDQITQLVAQGNHPPFAVTVGIGQAGERVARQLHQRTGWFPIIHRVDVTREEDGQGGYNLVSTTCPITRRTTPRGRNMSSLAVVDDTVFSGLTMCTVLRALPSVVLAPDARLLLARRGGIARQYSAPCPSRLALRPQGACLMK